MRATWLLPPTISATTTRPRLALALALAWVGAPRAEAAKIHVIVAADTLDPRIGKNVEVDLREVQGTFRENVPVETGVLSIRALAGAECHPAAIRAAIAGLAVGPDDAVVVTYHGHGAYDPQAGQYLSFPRLGNQYLTRADLVAVVRAKRARLGVIATDCCNKLSVLPRRQILAPSMQAPMKGPVPQVSVLFRALFLNSMGFVDLTSSKRDEQSISHPAARTADGVEQYGGGLFTAAIVGVLNRSSGRVLTWEEVSERASQAVRAAFGRIKPDGLDNPEDPERPQMTQTLVAAIAVRVIRPTAPDDGPEGGNDAPVPDDWPDPAEDFHSAQTLGVLGIEAGGRGLYVFASKPGSPAARLGLERGDVILAMNDNVIRTARGYHRTLLRAEGAVELTFRDVRTGQSRVTVVELATPGSRPRPHRPAPGDPPTFGAAVTAVAGGVRVDGLGPGSPAALLQLDPGDVITAINGRAVGTQEDYRAAIAASPDEMWFSLRNVRSGQLQEMVATLDRRAPGRGGGPDDPPAVDRGGRGLGVYGFDNAGGGLYIWGSRPGSAAAGLGLERHDLILAVDGAPIRDVLHYREALDRSGGQVELTIRDCRTGQVRRARIALDSPPPGAANQSVFGVLGAEVPGGIRIQAVQPGTAAHRVGLDPGDVILTINGTAVRTTAEYLNAVHGSPAEMTFTVWNVRTGRLLGMVVPLDH